jgi:putative endonuclease
MAGYVYIMSNCKDGPLYTGVTADLSARIYQHRNSEGSTFCKRYGLTRLVYCENYDRIDDAIAREKQIKKWRRAWKVNLIESINPEWGDLYLALNQ